MFRARKPSVKRQKLDDSKPRKRVKLTNPVKELLKNETASTAEGPVKPSGLSKTEDSAMRRSLRNIVPPKSKKAIKDDKEDAVNIAIVNEDSIRPSPQTQVISDSKVNVEPVSRLNIPVPVIKVGAEDVGEDEKKIARRIGEKVGEISPCTVERTSEEVEDDKEVAVVNVKTVHHTATVPEKEREEDENEIAGDDDELAKGSLGCDSENVEELDNSGLWPPNYVPKDEEFVTVRTERIVDPENDPVIDAALSLLP